MAGRHNIVATKGDTFTFNCTVATDGVNWDFTSYTARFTVRKSSASADTLIAASTDSEITLTSAGHISITVPSANMVVPTGRWVYDLEVTTAGGESTTLLSGRFIVEAEVSY